MFVMAGLISTQYIDYDLYGYVVKRELSGSPVRTCLDLPERYWVRYEKCHPEYYMESEDEIPRGGAIGLTEGPV